MKLSSSSPVTLACLGLLALSSLHVPIHAAQDVPIEREQVDEATQKKRDRRKRDVDRLFNNLDQLNSVWDDEQAVARGSAMLETLIETAGGRAAWTALGGSRFDVLESRRALVHRRPDKWAVHHYVPRLCAFTLEGDGYVYSEFAEIRDEEPRPDYLREVSAGDLGWTEKDGNYFRSEEVSEQAQAQVRRMFLLTAMPFSLDALGAKLAFVREERVIPRGKKKGKNRAQGTTDEDEDEDEAEDDEEARADDEAASGEAGAGKDKGVDTGLDVYALRIEREGGILMEHSERIDEFLLLVDREQKRVVQLQYILSGDDRDSLETPYTRSYIDFGGELALGDLRFSGERLLRHEDPVFMLRWVSAAPYGGELEPAALRKPWLGNPVYEPPYRASTWDPPPADPRIPSPESEAPRPPRDGADGEAGGSDGR